MPEPHYALNIADLTRFDPMFISMLLGDVIRNQEIVKAEKGRVDGSAVVLDTNPERARALIEFIHRQDERLEHNYLTRAYSEGPRGGWSKVKKEKTDGS